MLNIHGNYTNFSGDACFALRNKKWIKTTAGRITCRI